MLCPRSLVVRVAAYASPPNAVCCVHASSTNKSENDAELYKLDVSVNRKLYVCLSPYRVIIFLSNPRISSNYLLTL